jgi:PAS domain S-box-containing protein
MQFPVGGGINGLAASTGAPVSTDDYLVDPRIPHTPDDQAVALRLGLRRMAAAPLRGLGGEVIGTLAVSHVEPGQMPSDDVVLLQGLADQAAIAVANARLYEGLLASEERYRYLLQDSPDLIFAVDPDGTFTFLSPATLALTGWKPEELLGQPVTTLVYPDALPSVERTWAALKAAPDVEQRLRLQVLHRDGRALAGELSALGIVVDERFAGAHGSVRDMHERDRLERDLRRQAAELASAQERAHLARELHDSVTQALFSMTLTTRSIELLLDTDPEEASARLAELRVLEREALAEMRSLIFELRPANLEQDGLVQAVRTHAAAVQGRTGLPIQVEADPVARLPREVEHALFRIAQEALHNVVKHASAGRVRIGVRVAGDVAELVVEDDGVGFDPATVGSGRLGLAGMRTRAEQLGGMATFEAVTAGGTRVTARVPVDQDAVKAPGASAE